MMDKFLCGYMGRNRRNLKYQWSVGYGGKENRIGDEKEREKMKNKKCQDEKNMKDQKKLKKKFKQNLKEQYLPFVLRSPNRL